MCRILSIFLLLFCNQGIAQQSLKLWYDKPSRIWEEALPLGNGRLGAMVFGQVSRERVQLNDNTLWSGFPNPGNNANGPQYLPMIRKAVFDGDYAQAALHWKKMQGPYSARYLTMADLFIDFHFPDSAVTNYKRELDLKTAVHSVTYKHNGITYKREILASFPDSVIVIHLTADKPLALSFEIGLTSKLRYQTKAIAPNHLVLTGKAPKHVAHRPSEPEQIVYDDAEGMTFEIDVKVKIDGGNLARTDSVIKISKANSVTLYISSGTSFNGFDKSPGQQGKDPAAESTVKSNAAFSKSFTQIKARHIADHKKLFDRVDFQLPSNAALEQLPTNVRLSRQGITGNDQGLQVLYYQFGRYLMIASSRPGSQATNLQGIWNDHVQPPWGSNYTVNINTEMNYWPAGNTNLSELQQPLFHFIKRLSVNGAVTAKVNYGIDSGWVVHHNSDIWAKTSPAGGYEWDPRSAARWSCWPMAGAWLSTHIYDHYLYTADKKFLNDHYKYLRGACEFLLKWIVQDENGNYVTNPSTSPENIFKVNGKDFEISMATSMDLGIIREVFYSCIESAKALKVDQAFIVRLQDVLDKLYPYHIGQYGQLQEWFKDWDDPKDNHRHLSHLFGLYPGNHITITNTPELAAAAKQSLIHRGDVSTGWSMAWKINWWARLKDGDHALRILKAGLTLIDPAGALERQRASRNDTGQLSNFQMSGGGTYPNLFDAHPPFQIDGNFGATAGITEMLMQSHDGMISLLPALPAEWRAGKIHGIKARGNFTINLDWKDSKLNKATILSNSGGNCRLQTTIPVRVAEVPSKPSSGNNPNSLAIKHSAVQYKKNSNAKLPELNIGKGFIIDFMTEKGKTYTIIPLK